MGRRSSKATAYARGEETRLRILSAAMILFGRLGFETVTTRMIAADAGVPAPSIRYYFDSKEGLYSACWSSIQTQLVAAMEPALEAAEQLIAREAVDRTLLIDAFCNLQSAYLDHMLSRDNSEEISKFIARHDLASTSGGTRLSMGGGTSALRMASCFTRMIMRISNGALDWQSALVVAGLTNGQVEPIVAKRSSLAEFGIIFDDDRLNWLRQTIRQQSIAILLLHCT